IDFKKMFLDCVIGRRGITIQLPPSSLAKNIFLKSIKIVLSENVFGLRYRLSRYYNTASSLYPCQKHFLIVYKRLS
ncbi:MAG: hypothetical protein PVJ19_20505, partial [Desulfobacteraceae bacterium]